MKRFIACLVALLTLSVSRADESVTVKIDYYKDQYYTGGMGSGVVVLKEGKKAIVLTNQHVVPDHGNRIYVNWVGGYSVKAELIGHAYAADLAALLVPVGENFKAAKLAKNSPADYTELHQIGYPRGIGPRHSFGFSIPTNGMQSKNKLTGRLFDMLRHTAVTDSGDSGSPIFNKEDELVGMVWGGQWVEPAVFDGAAVHLNEIKTFLTWDRIKEKLK